MRADDDKHSLWTAKERQQNEEAVSLQKTASNFVAQYIYYDVPITIKKQSVDPASPIWISIDYDKIKEVRSDRLDKDEPTAVFDTKPTGIR